MTYLTKLTARLASFGAAVALAVLGTASAATAVTQTFNVTGGFSGGQLGTVTFDFTVTHDFTVTVDSETTGLVVNSVTSSALPGDPIALTDEIPGTGGATGYSFSSSSSGGFTFGGGESSSVSSTDDDFVIFINDLSSGSPSFIFASDSLRSLLNLGRVAPSSFSLTVTEVLAPVPVPASGLLLAGALLGGVAMRRRAVRKR